MRPEFRRDPLNHVWVVYSPERQRRPSDFGLPVLDVPHLDPFAPGNERFTPSEVYAARETGLPNQPGWRVRVVPNRFPAVRIEGELESTAQGLYDRMTGIGAHEVVIETPEPTEPLEALSTAHVVDILNGYRARMLDLNNDQRFRLIYVFRNVGALSGASLVHAHSQIVALPLIPAAIEAKLQRAKAYYEAKERSLFTDILQAERKAETRVVAENDAFVLFCPYASRFPFELALYPKRSGPNFTDCTASETQLLAEMLRTALGRINQVLEKPSYNLLLHTAPLVRPGPDGIARYASTRLDYSWHLEILPRLGFLAGFELGLGSYINTVFPEDAARFLRGEAIR